MIKSIVSVKKKFLFLFGYLLFISFFSLNASPFKLEISGNKVLHTGAPAQLIARLICESDKSCCEKVKIEQIDNLPLGLFFHFHKPSMGIISGTPLQGTEGVYPITFKVSTWLDDNTIAAYTFEQSLDLTVRFKPLPNPPNNFTLKIKKKRTNTQLPDSLTKPIGCKTRHHRTDHILEWELPNQPVGESPILNFRIYRDENLRQLIGIISNNNQDRFKFIIRNTELTKKNEYYIISVNGLGMVSRHLISQKRK